MINDSFGRAWRNGTVGTAIGVAGPPGLWDMRGLPDRNGRVLRATEVGIADKLGSCGMVLNGSRERRSARCPRTRVPACVSAR